MGRALRSASRRSATLVLLLGLGLFLASAAPVLAGDPLSRVERAWLEQHGPVVVGCFLDYPPFGFVDKQGRPTGITVDFWTRLALDLDFAVQFEPVPFAAQVKGLEQGRFDSLAGMFIMPRREKRFLFSEPWLFINTNMFVRPSLAGKVRSLQDLRGLRVGVVQGDSGQTLVSDAGLTGRAYSEYAQAVRALGAGELDAVVMDEPAMFYLRARLRLWDSITEAGPAVDRGAVALPVRRGDIMLYSILSKGVSRQGPKAVDNLVRKYRLARTPDGGCR